MKKILLLLLLVAPFLGVAQTEIKHEWVNLPANIAVGDTITYKHYILDLSGTNRDIRLVQTDIAYNSKKLVRVGEPTWDTNWNSQSKSVNHWVNYTYNSGANGTDANDLDAQFTEGLGGKYSAGDWNIQRHTLQSTVDIEGALFTQKFTVKDISSSNYTDYLDAIRLNWAYVRDASNNVLADVYGNPQKLDIGESVSGSPAGTVTWQLQTPNAVNGNDYIIVIEPLALHQAYQNQDPSTIDYSQYPPVVQGNLNTSGQFVTTGLKQGVEYIFNVFVKSEWDANTQSGAYPQWLDDVVTVSDVMQVFKQAIGTEPDGTGNVFEFNIQKQLANVVQKGPNDPVDFDDSYALLAHIAGVLDNSAGNPNADANTPFYPITSFNNGAFNWSGWFDTFGKSANSYEEWLSLRTFTLADDQAVTFNVAHGLMGDVDFSHSTRPNVNDDTKIALASLAKSKLNIMRSTARENVDLDVISQLKNGKVEVVINLTKQDLAGMQFNITYDKSMLTFNDITFDTGNTMTNFAKHFDDGRINFGTINIQSANIKPGKPFKLIFTPKATIQNTIGLVNFRVTDAVKHDGTKVNLNIK